MFIFKMIAVIGMPLAMAIGGIVAWRQSKRGNDPVAVAADTWRDTSLDDWRRERDEQVELEREMRVANPGPSDTAASGKEESVEKKQQHRIGG